MFADEKPETALLGRETRDTPLYQAWADAPIEAPRPSAPEAAAMADLRELTQPEADPGVDPTAMDLPLPYFHTTGSQLRHRLVTAESIAELQAQEKPRPLLNLLRRLSGRK